MNLVYYAVSGLILVAGYSIAIFPSGLVVAWVLGKVQTSILGTPRVGMWIGWCERFLVVTFVLLDQGAALGFVVAAKSLLRFGEKGGRDSAEYVILGTMTSLSIGVFMALVIKFALAWASAALANV